MDAGLVPKAGLEPACLATHAPETCVSTNFTTSADFKPSFITNPARGRALQRFGRGQIYIHQL